MYSMSNRNPEEQKKPQKRLEYIGKNVRISRTGGFAVRKTFKKDGVGATLNTKHGIRLHKRLFKGARMGFQNGNFQFIGSYNSGPFNFNVSKTGVSSSIKNKRGLTTFLSQMAFVSSNSSFRWITNYTSEESNFVSFSIKLILEVVPGTLLMHTSIFISK
jgi:hypothetical protein